MTDEGDVWVMHGLDWDNPYRIRSFQELINWINEVGFLPLFRNEIEGFSAEEHTSPRFWWTGDKEQDPWEWREIIARTGTVAYGKFFNKKAGLFLRNGFHTLLITEGRGMILTADGKMNWPVSAVKRLWISLNSKRNCILLS